MFKVTEYAALIAKRRAMFRLVVLIRRIAIIITGRNVLSLQKRLPRVELV